jgi:hypothetical protein
MGWLCWQELQWQMGWKLDWNVWRMEVRWMLGREETDGLKEEGLFFFFLKWMGRVSLVKTSELDGDNGNLTVNLLLQLSWALEMVKIVHIMPYFTSVKPINIWNI